MEVFCAFSLSVTYLARPVDVLSASTLAHLIEQRDVDLVVVNAENAAGGFGVTPGIADELFDQGAHVLTTGNHVWDKREIIEYMQSVPADSHESRTARAAAR